MKSPSLRNAVQHFRPIGACLRRTPFWRTKTAAQTFNTALRSRLYRPKRSRRERCAAVTGPLRYVGRQNKVEGRQAPAQPSRIVLPLNLRELLVKILHSVAVGDAV